MVVMAYAGQSEVPPGMRRWQKLKQQREDVSELHDNCDLLFLASI